METLYPTCHNMKPCVPNITQWTLCIHHVLISNCGYPMSYNGHSVSTMYTLYHLLSILSLVSHTPSFVSTIVIISHIDYSCDLNHHCECEPNPFWDPTYNLWDPSFPLSRLLLRSMDQSHERGCL